MISIHAPREGGDRRSSPFPLSEFVISIHAPREGGDSKIVETDSLYELFQSTPPARGATIAKNRPRSASLYFNPRPPRGGRL